MWPTYFRVASPVVQHLRLRPHLRPMIQRNRSPNHPGQWGTTPVKPTPNPKRHPEDKKGKGKGDGKDRGRSTSVDKKKIPCKFLAKGKCNSGKGCPYSHKRTRTPSRGTHQPKVKETFLAGTGFEGTARREKNVNFIMTPKQRPRRVCPQLQILERTSPSRSLHQSRSPRESRVLRR